MFLGTVSTSVVVLSYMSQYNLKSYILLTNPSTEFLNSIILTFQSGVKLLVAGENKDCLHTGCEDASKL